MKHWQAQRWLEEQAQVSERWAVVLRREQGGKATPVTTRPTCCLSDDSQGELDESHDA
jgi:hypothetical protein